jgi:excisionase family DNA binding protein
MPYNCQSGWQKNNGHGWGNREKKMSDDRKDQLVADGLWTVPQASKFLGLSRSKVYAMMEAGQLAFVKLGSSRRIPRKAVIELVRSSLVGG